MEIEIPLNPHVVSEEFPDEDQKLVDAYAKMMCEAQSVHDMVLTAGLRVEAGTTDPNRPYDGQVHTGQGERGKQVVDGLTMRDLADCMVKGIGHAANDQLTEEAYDRLQKDQYEYGELYDLDLNKVDIIAAVQNFGVEVEKRMGIYPNLPKAMLEAIQERGNV
tara:strand:- start:28107 stop:28595 length:489 start_codon:yes stop_codon:yes gene_type:complete